MSLKKLKLRHIDNGFYRCSARQAKALCGTYGLPRPGYAMTLDPRTLGNVVLLRRSAREGAPWLPIDDKATDYGGAEIVYTACSWHDGAEVPGGGTWALKVHTLPLIRARGIQI